MVSGKNDDVGGADAEIKKIEEEIKRSYKAIDRWRSGRMPGSSLYDIDEKVRRI